MCDQANGTVQVVSRAVLVSAPETDITVRPNQHQRLPFDAVSRCRDAAWVDQGADPPRLTTIRGHYGAGVDEIGVIGGPLVAAIVPGLLAETASRSELGTELLAVTAPPRRAAAVALLRKAVERGELPEDLHLEVATDLIAGPLVIRMLILGKATVDYLPVLISAIEAALPAARPPGPRGAST